MNIRKKTAILLAGWMFGHADMQAFSQQKEQQVIILSTNDVHGRIDNFGKLAAYAKALKKDHADVFVLNAGDLINGNPVIDEAKDKGFPIIDIMNRIPYDVSIPGNHEFENGEENLQRRIRQSTSVYVCANMIPAPASPLKPLAPYHILHMRDGTAIAVLGLTSGSSNPCLIRNVSFADPIDKAIGYKALKRDNPILVGLTHIGYDKDSVLATRMGELDVIIGGHSHTAIPHGKTVNGVLITQTGDWLRYVGKTVLTVKDHKVTGKTFEMVDFASLTDVDADVQARIDAYDHSFPFGQAVGRAAAPFRNKEELGALKTDAIAVLLHLDVAFDPVRNVAISGISQGPIRIEDLYVMDPFDYDIFRYELKPADIRRMILRSIDRRKGATLFVSGMTYTVQTDSSGRATEVQLRDRNGNPPDEGRSYSVGVNSYIACHYLPGIAGGVSMDTTAVGILIRYLSMHPDVDYAGVKRIFAGEGEPERPASGKSLVQLIRGPYLQSATPHSIIVRWRTDALSRGRVRYGTDSARLDRFVDDSSLATEHIIRVDGLSPGTRYYYSIGQLKTMLQGDSNNYFMTLPAERAAGRYRIGVIGDCGNNSVNQRNVAQALMRYLQGNYLNAWILLGDNAYSDGTDAEFQAKFFNVYKDDLLKKFPLFPAPGNHDYHDIESSAEVAQKTHAVAYYQNFSMPSEGESGGVPSHTRAFYSFDVGNIHFLSLDSYGKEEGMYSLYDTTGPQAAWVKKDLEANAGKGWIVAYWHHPPFTMGSHNSDHEGQLVKIRQNFIRILERYGVDLVLCGHSHDYERSKLMKGYFGMEADFSPDKYYLSTSSGKYDGTPNSCPYIKDPSNQGTIYVVSGSAGQLGGKQAGYPHDALPFADATNGGSCILEADGNRLDLKWICADGVIRDQFTMMKEVNKRTVLYARKGESVTLTASYAGGYVWKEQSSASRSIEVKPGVGTTLYSVHDPHNCLQDVFEVHVEK